MELARVVPYIGTWIETKCDLNGFRSIKVVPYIGTWIETRLGELEQKLDKSYLI